MEPRYVTIREVTNQLEIADAREPLCPFLMFFREEIAAASLLIDHSRRSVTNNLRPFLHAKFDLWKRVFTTVIKV